jgi:hypothetical protein
VRKRRSKPQSVLEFGIIMFLAAIGVVIIIVGIGTINEDPCRVEDPPIPKLDWCGKVELQNDVPVTLISPEGEYVVTVSSTPLSFRWSVKHPAYTDTLRYADDNISVATANLVTTFDIGDVVIQRWGRHWFLWYKATGSGNLSLKSAK